MLILLRLIYINSSFIVILVLLPSLFMFFWQFQCHFPENHVARNQLKINSGHQASKIRFQFLPDRYPSEDIGQQLVNSIVIPPSKAPESPKKQKSGTVKACNPSLYRTILYRTITLSLYTLPSLRKRPQPCKQASLLFAIPPIDHNR